MKLLSIYFSIVLILVLSNLKFTYAQISLDTTDRFNGISIKNSIVDSRDGNKYVTIQINNQIWFAENLKYKPDSGKYWYPENNPETINSYGYLYSWKTAQSVCPAGFRIPSKEDFEELFNSIGTDRLALKLTKSQNIGFNALFVGSKIGLNFVPYGHWATFWTSRSRNSIYAWAIGFGPNDPNVEFGAKFTKKSGLTIRCVKNTH